MTNIYSLTGFCIVSEVAQSYPTLCNPMDCSLPHSSIHGIFQARVLEWIAISSSRGIFPTQGPNPGLLHCRQMLYHLSHQGFCIRGRKIWAPPKKRVKILDRTGIWALLDKNIPSMLNILSLSTVIWLYNGKSLFCGIVCICTCLYTCLTLYDPMNCSLPGSSVHGILQARILEWVAISFSRASSRPRKQARVSCIAGRFFTNWAMSRGLTESCGRKSWNVKWTGDTFTYCLIFKKEKFGDCFLFIF